MLWRLLISNGLEILFSFSTSKERLGNAGSSVSFLELVNSAIPKSKYRDWYLFPFPKPKEKKKNSEDMGMGSHAHISDFINWSFPSCWFSFFFFSSHYDDAVALLRTGPHRNTFARSAIVNFWQLKNPCIAGFRTQMSRLGVALISIIIIE